MKFPNRRQLLLGLGALALVLLAIQAIPYGRHHTNPPIVREPAWDSPRTRQLAVRACFDCHSNETRWPWYAAIAPVSWLVQHDVDEGRHELNFSDWQGGTREGEKPEELREEIEEGAMPPLPFLLLHPEARLTEAEEKELVAGLVATATRELSP